MFLYKHSFRDVYPFVSLQVGYDLQLVFPPLNNELNSYYNSNNIINIITIASIIVPGTTPSTFAMHYSLYVHQLKLTKKEAEEQRG